MSRRSNGASSVPKAARVFNDLQANDALLPGEASAVRKSSAVLLAMLVIAAVPLYWAANAAGLIGDVPAAVAKGSNSGPGGGGEDNSGPGSGDDDDDDRTLLKTDDTSANGHSTRGTTNDNDTRTQRGTDDTSRNGHSTRGTTRDNDTRTNTRNSATGTQTRTRTGR
jgi:hypothetical protein